MVAHSGHLVVIGRGGRARPRRGCTHFVTGRRWAFLWRRFQMRLGKIPVAVVACGLAASAMATAATAKGRNASGGSVAVAGVIALTGSSDFEGQNQVGGLY